MQLIRAYVALLYRQEKLRLLEETLRVNERLVSDVDRLIKDLGKLRPADRILAQTEVTDTFDLIGSARESLTSTTGLVPDKQKRRYAPPCQRRRASAPKGLLLMTIIQRRVRDCLP